MAWKRSLARMASISRPRPKPVSSSKRMGPRRGLIPPTPAPPRADVGAREPVDLLRRPPLDAEAVADVLVEPLPGEEPEVLEHHGHLGPGGGHPLGAEDD